MTSKSIYFYIKILAVIGIALAVYLLWEQLFRPSFQPCSINATVNCDAIISGAVAQTLGIPTPLYGLIGYIVILLSAIFKKKKLLLGMALFGLLFCLYIAFREIFQLHVICPVCIMCQVDMLTVFTLALILNRQKQA